MIKYAWKNKNTFYMIISIFQCILQNNENKFVNKNFPLQSRASDLWAVFESSSTLNKFISWPSSLCLKQSDRLSLGQFDSFDPLSSYLGG